MLPSSDGLRNEPLLPRSASFGAGTPAWRSLVHCPSFSRECCGAGLDALPACCVLANCCVLAVALLNMLSLLSLLTPLRFLTALYLVAFSAAAAAYEANLALLEGYRRWLEVYLLMLAHRRGRGVFYMLLGTLTAGLGDPFALAAGIFELACGAACVRGARASERDDAASEADSEVSRQSESAASRPQMAFRRRVPFGLERLDSAELASLCLELGLPLDARARGTALDLLDPAQQGTIGEDAFLDWWEAQEQQPRPLGQLGSLNHAWRTTA